MIRKALVAAIISSVLGCAELVYVAAQHVWVSKPVALPCIPRKHGDPWNHNSAILDSYPIDKSKRYLGAFRDKRWNYQLELYSDARGVFGEILNPVLEADSPVSRLYDAFFDPKLGTLRFQARFPFGNLQFEGALKSQIVRGTVTRYNRTEKVILRRVKLPAEDSYTSRQQFDCAMILFHRY